MVKNEPDNNAEIYSCFSVESAPISKELVSLEHDFFKCFEIALEEEGDPYYEV